ncbi:alpha/beta hydrolase [Sphingomonas sp. 2R-10]|uniref:alpha/beta fold hydrolase n=1 Tax=Sphingomonas sp. 2R-10 TaxID=3045148 RepID=UPI000F76B107|nr:alpha/beta hydrolase [Sphingomonas sp. 2R-10]MDJ0275696.1 alpha/beta hydrolase [Sphingomonas sp. 2R-10]
MSHPTLIFLHALGMSGAEWRLVRESLDGFASIAPDLPGFGAAADAGYRDVAAMADAVEGVVRGAGRCVLVGQSMGGKVASVLAARGGGMSGIAGVVLVAASPPSPEPIEDMRRREMLGWATPGPIGTGAAAAFVDGNCARPLPAPLRHAAMADVRRSNPAAWRGWLEAGSREDWREAVGVVQLPALIVAGREDGDLGEAAQRKLNLPHYPDAQVRVIADAAHLIPLEQPGRLATLIRAFVADQA